MRIGESTMILIDFQQRLVPAMSDPAALISRARILIEGAKALGLPILMSEQYPKGLGSTVPEIADLVPGISPIPKTQFSCVDVPVFMEALRATGKKFCIIAGIETHVCVLQTVVDLVAQGFVPVVVSDACASRRTTDHEVAIARMMQEGAIIGTSESVLFELCREAGTERFKTISRLIK